MAFIHKFEHLRTNRRTYKEDYNLKKLARLVYLLSYTRTFGKVIWISPLVTSPLLQSSVTPSMTPVSSWSNCLYFFTYKNYILLTHHKPDIIISIQPLGLFWKEPEPSQATGMATARCISRQVRGSLPLLSPAFRRSQFRHQMAPRPHQRECS
jgi:hypothetical protein